jgi:hypothetical protein
MKMQKLLAAKFIYSVKGSNYITKVEVQEDRSEALQPMLRHGVF